MKARDHFKSLTGASLAVVLVLLGAAGAAQAAAPNITGTGAAPDILDTETSRPFENVRLTDGDGDDVILRVSFPVAEGALPIVAGFTRAGDIYTLTQRSPLAATLFLSNLVFTPTLNSISIGSTRTTTFAITLTDTNGLADTDSQTRVEVTPVNDRPTIAGAGGAFSIGDNQTNQPFATVTLADVDNLGAQPLTLTVIIDKPAQGNFTNGTLASFVFSSSNRYTFSGTPAAATTAIRGLLFRPRENRLPVGASEITRFTVIAADDGTPSLSATNAATQVTVTSINDVPQIGGIVSSPQPVRTGSSLLPFSGAIISDPDVNADPARAGQDLTVTILLQGTSVIGELNPPGGLATTVTMMNLTATEASAAIQALLYSAPAFPVPFGTTNRMTATTIITDSAGGSRTNSLTLIDVYSPFTPPGLSGTRADQRVNDKNTIAPFSTVSIQSLNGGAFAVLVQLDNDAKGELNNLSGFVKTNGTRATYTFTGASEAATLAIRQLLFRPTENRLHGSTTETALFEITLLDGGTVSGPDSSTTVIVSPVNDRPLIQNIPPLIRITDNETTRPFRTVTISDLDERGTQSVHVVVTLDDTGKGLFASNSLGAFIASSGGYSFDGSGAAATLAISNLLFVPTENRVPIGESETTVFTITIDDGHGGLAINTGTSVRVASVAGAPEIVVPTPQPISRPLAPPLFPFESVLINDEEDLTVTIALLDPGQGAFTSNSLATTGFTNSGPGTVIFHGTVEAVSNAVTRLEFAPNTNLPPGVITFSITALDATGNSVTATHSILLRIIQRVYVVTQRGDYDIGESDPGRILGTLRKAVEDAGSNDHITFDLDPETNGVPALPATIRLRRSIALPKNVTIDGPGASLLAISGDMDADGIPDVQLFQVTAQARLNRLTLTKGSADSAGGAVSVRPGGNLAISYCAVTESQAEQWGGGIDVEGGGLQMDHCLIAGNRTIAAVGQGGGGVAIYSDQHCLIENTTFSGNSQQAPGGLGGGGLYVENLDPGTPLLIQVNGCTFRDNTDEASGGTSIRPNVFHSQVLLKNTIVADGRGENLDVDDSGLIVSFGGNISDDSTRTIFSFGGEPYEVVIFEPPGDKTNAAPGLAPLAVNAGPTLTYALQTGSPALAAAVTNTLGTDQRGYWRDQTPDSGAFEQGLRRQIIINEIAYDPAPPNTNDEFIEFYVPRAVTTNVDLAFFQLYIGGELRHTFTPQPIAPGQGLVLFSKDATSTNIPSQVFKQVATNNLLLDNNADVITLKNPAGQVVWEVSYVGSFTASDPNATNLFGAHQSLTLEPEFTGVFLPYQRAYRKVIGITPNPNIVSSPGTEISGRSLAGGNAPPVAFDDRFTTDENTALPIPVLENDVELDGSDFLRLLSVSAPQAPGATATLTASNIIYNPSGSALLQSLPEGSNRIDSFTYSLIDCCDPGTGGNWPTALGGRYLATNFITVLGVNDAPTPQADSVATNPRLRTLEDRELEINLVTDLLPNDTDPDTDDDNTTLDIAGIHTTSTHEDTFLVFSELGALVLLELRFNRSETRILYDPSGSPILNALSQGEVTNDVFYYSLIDRHGAIGVAQVRVQVTGTNDLPTAVTDGLATDEDTQIRLPTSALLGNDTDPDTDDNQTTLATLRFAAINGATSLVSTTAFGARIEVAGNEVIYTPTVSAALNALSRKEVVVDSFTYTTTDNFAGSNTTTVLVTVTGVNDTPVTTADTKVIDEDTVAITPAPGVLANDIDFDINGTAPDDRLRVLAATNAPTAQGATFSIDADGSYLLDPRGRFDYLRQGQTTNDSFSYTVVDDSYTIANNDTFSVAADATGVVLAVLANDVTLTGTGGRLQVVAVGTPSSGGTVVLGAAGTSLVYTPQINFVGVESFQYAIEDGQGGHDTATVRVAVTVPVLNGNLVANDDRFTVARGTTATLLLLANDNIVPAAGDVLTLVSVGPADRGATVALTATGPNNAVRFSPDTNVLVFPYTERFTYTVSGGGVALATGAVTVTVVNRQGILPVSDDVFTVIAGASTSSLNVLANDRIVPDTTTNLFITGIQTNGVSGLVSIHPDANRLLYTPPVGSISHVEAVFYYFISDGSGGTATGAVTVTVMQLGLNANDDFYQVARGSTNTLFVLLNDNALPNFGQNLLISTTGLSNNVPNRGGSLTISPNGRSVSYAPSPTNFTGEEMFTYEITDGTLPRAEGRVKVKIIDRQGVVNVNPDAFSVVRDTTNNLLRVLLNDNVQPDTRERLTITALGTPNRGGTTRLVGTAPNQTVLYSPPRGFVGDEDFTYSVADNRGGTAITTARVHVGYLIANTDLFTVLSESQNNLLEVRANDELLPNVTPLRPILAVGSPNHGGTVQANAARDALLYRPASGFVGLESFTYDVANDSGGIVTAQATVHVLPAGGDRDTATVAITVVGVNDPPTIAGTGSAGTITDKQTIHPFPTVVIGEVDDFGQQTLTVVVTFEAGHGILTDLGSFTQSGPAAYTFVGTAPQATAALRGLVYDPIENRIIVPTSELTTFTISAHDGFVSQPVTNNATTLTVIAVNDPPIISGTVSNQTVYHRWTIKPFAGTTITEVDDSKLQPLQITVRLDDPTHGFLTSLGAFVDAGGGVYTLGTGTGVTAATASSALRALVFTPTTALRVTPGSPETTRFQITVDDHFAAPLVTDTNTTVLALHEFVTKLLASDGVTGDSFGAAVAARSDVVVVGAPQDDDHGNGSGAAYIYVRNQVLPDSWIQFQKLSPADGAAGDEFGYAVTISGNTIAVGARFDREPTISSGSVYVFERSLTGTSNWVQTRKLVPTDGANLDEFGAAVSLDRDTLVVGSRADDDNGSSSGSAYLYSRNQGGTTNWGLIKKLRSTDAAAGDQFGFSVNVHGTNIVIGAPFDVHNAVATGSAYVFSRDQGGTTNWGQIKKLVPSDGLAPDEFGASVGIAGDSVVVGSRKHDHLGNDTGAAYVFARDQGGINNWGQLTELLQATVLNNDQFGYSVSISRDKLVAGMPFSGFDNQSKYGSAFAHLRDFGGPTNWGVVQKLDRADPENNDQFGLAVAIGQDTAVIGVNLDDDRGSDSGSAYLYRLKYNNSPRLVTPIAAKTALINNPFSFVVPADTFGDADINDTLTLAATLSTGAPLPAWLAFSPVTQTFSGTPTIAATYTIRVTATDEDGATAVSVFQLTVADSFGFVAAAEVACAIMNDPANGQVLLLYHCPSGATGYVLETSTDMVNWVAPGSLVTGQSMRSIDAATDQVILQLRATERARFFRVKVSIP